MKIILLSLLLLFSVIVKGQTVIKANNPGIKYNLIQPGHTSSKFMVFDSAGRKVHEYIMDNFITVDKSSGETALIRSSVDESSHAVYTDTSFISASPLRMHSTENPAHKELQVKFEPTEVKVRSIIDGVSKDEVFPVNEGYFDDNILVDILGFFPLKQGEKYAMEGFRYESVKTKGVASYEVEYVHDDYLTVGDNNFLLCKVIYYKNDYRNGYAWYDKLTGKPVKLLFYQKKTAFLVNFGK